MKRVVILVWAFLTLALQAASVTLAWDPSPSPNIAGYRLYYGTPPGAFDIITNCGDVTNFTVVDLQPGRTYSFYVTCYNTSGLESEPSNVVEYTPPGSSLPNPPQAVTVTSQPE